MGPGAGFQALVEFGDGRLVKVKLGGGFTGDSGSEDVDAAIDRRRGDKPIGVRGMKEDAGDAAADPATDELRTQAMEIFRNLSGVQQNELDMVELLLNLIELAKSENINQQELRRRLGLAKDAAAKIAK